MTSILLTATYNDGLVKDHIISTLAPRLNPPLSPISQTKGAPNTRGNNSPASSLSPSDPHKDLVEWNNLTLNVEKTKGLIIAPLNSHQQQSSGPKSLQRVARRAEEIIQMLPRSRMLLTARSQQRTSHTHMVDCSPCSPLGGGSAAPEPEQLRSTTVPCPEPSQRLHLLLGCRHISVPFSDAL